MGSRNNGTIADSFPISVKQKNNKRTLDDDIVMISNEFKERLF
jgi:hypothetical protein